MLLSFQRLDDVLRRVNVMPLGSGALAGQAFGLDRQTLASALGFDGCTTNSLVGCITVYGCIRGRVCLLFLKPLLPFMIPLVDWLAWLMG